MISNQEGSTMNPLMQLKAIIPSILVPSVLACLGFSSTAWAVLPAPDGGYPGGNTAEGQNALLSLATGTSSTLQSVSSR